MLGIVGDNAAGKTTLTKGIVHILGMNGVTPICLDDYYRYNRAERAARGLTALSPKNSAMDVMTRHLGILRAGGSIRKPVYDHRTGTLRGPELVVATGLIVVHGLLTLATPELKSMFDLSVYLDPHPSLLHQWRLRRDVTHRGYTRTQVEASIAESQHDAEQYIRPQRRLADLVIRFFPNTAAASSMANTCPCQFNVHITLRHSVARLDLDNILGRDAQGELPHLRWRRNSIDEDGREADTLEIDADISSTEAAALENLLWEDMPELRPLQPHELGNLRVGHEQYHSDTLALAQLLVVYQLVHAGKRSGRQTNG